MKKISAIEKICLIIILTFTFISFSASINPELVKGRMEYSENIEVAGKKVSRTIIYEAGKSPVVSQIMIDGESVKDPKIWLDDSTFINLSDLDLHPKKKWMLYIKPLLIGLVIFIIVFIIVAVAVILKKRKSLSLKYPRNE